MGSLAGMGDRHRIFLGKIQEVCPGIDPAESRAA